MNICLSIFVSVCCTKMCLRNSTFCLQHLRRKARLQLKKLTKQLASVATSWLLRVLGFMLSLFGHCQTRSQRLSRVGFGTGSSSPTSLEPQRVALNTNHYCRGLNN